MSSEMVERVAKAMWAERRRDAMERGIYLEDWEEGAPAFGAIANNIMGEARAAIEAMREPTEGMKDAGCEIGPDTNSGEFAHDDAYAVYTAMIDAALKDTP